MRLTTKCISALLILQCVIIAVPPLEASQQCSGSSSQSDVMDIVGFDSVGTVSFKGSGLRVYQINGVRVAEPMVRIVRSCAKIKYNNLYSKFQVSIPISIDINTLTSSRRHSKVGRVVLTDLEVITDKILARKDSRVEVMAQLKRSSGQGLLLFFCDSFVKCQAVKNEIASNPNELWRAVKFSPVGRVGSISVRFGATRSAVVPSFTCRTGRWVVFQKRVDGSLSFAQKWDAYVNGFGDIKSNYWMGLDQLFAMTVTGMGHGAKGHCRLRIETEDLNGKKYWGEYKKFQVFGPELKYQLAVGDTVKGSQIVMRYHNGMKFSTYDSDNDAYSKASCSRSHGFGGWWYNKCFDANLNGAYTRDKSITHSPNFCTFSFRGKFLPMKRTLMKFKCL